jgi:site-specific DNA-methyltransferase (adenine-specific)
MQLFNDDCLVKLADIPDKSVDAIITDPPYFEIKGDFDFKYKDFSSYLSFIEQCAIEWKRVLKSKGSLYVFCHNKRVAYIQVILDKYFNFENHLVWEKKECQTRLGINNFRCYAPVTERCLFYSCEQEKTGLQEIYDNQALFMPIKEYMRGERKKLMDARGFETLSEFGKYINELAGTSSVFRHYFGSSQYMFPTAEIYAKLQTTGFFQRDYKSLRDEYKSLRDEYKSLRDEYESLRRPFNNKYHLTDVIRHSQETHISKNIKHDTVKPLGLIIMFVETSTNENDVILDPFMGSGTTGIASGLLNRNFIGIELDKDYFNLAEKRITNELGLFKNVINE